MEARAFGLPAPVELSKRRANHPYDSSSCVIQTRTSPAAFFPEWLSDRGESAPAAGLTQVPPTFSCCRPATRDSLRPRMTERYRFGQICQLRVLLVLTID